MKTLKTILDKSHDYLAEKKIAASRRQAELLVADVLGLTRIDLYLDLERPLTEEEIKRCRAALQRRGKGEPLQYIHGAVEFLDCTLAVNNDVLIPRQETEILADMVVKSLEGESLAGKTLWDLCCGSGCLGIAMKKHFPELEVILSDVSPKALTLAQQNAKANDADVTCCEGDLLIPFQGKKADFIVCNPPYISEVEYATLGQEVKNFEPRLALVAPNEGLAFFERLAKELPKHLQPSGKVWLEIGYNQKEAVESLFFDACWTKKTGKKDWAGHDRFFLLEIE